MTIKETSNLWGGRFIEKPDETFARFNNSFAFDKRLFNADIRASMAHANGLRNAGVLTNEEAVDITDGLQTLLERSVSEKDFFEADVEDVHSFIESKLVELIGDTGK